MNPFESVSSKLDQLQRETKDTQTLPRPSEVSEVKPDVNRPSTGFGFAEPVEPESFSQVANDLSYSCLLIPRFIDHFLTGDITEYLADWMRQICVSYGWRLDAIVVRPGYLQWVITVPPTANPAQVIRLTRRHTSQKIFEEFPRFKQLNMSGDFWAPGYYVTFGTQLLSLENISNFTAATRRQQGIY